MSSPPKAKPGPVVRERQGSGTLEVKSRFGSNDCVRVPYT